MEPPHKNLNHNKIHFLNDISYQLRCTLDALEQTKEYFKYYGVPSQISCLNIIKGNVITMLEQIELLK